MWLSGSIEKLRQTFQHRLPDLLIAHMMWKKPAAKLPSLNEVHHAPCTHSQIASQHHTGTAYINAETKVGKREQKWGTSFVAWRWIEIFFFLFFFFSFPSLKFHRLDEAHLWHDCAKSSYQLSLIHFALFVITGWSFFRLKFHRKSPSTSVQLLVLFSCLDVFLRNFLFSSNRFHAQTTYFRKYFLSAQHSHECYGHVLSLLWH